MTESNYDKRRKEICFEDDKCAEANHAGKRSEEEKTKSALSYMASLCSRSEYCIYDIKEKLRKRELSEKSITYIIEYLLKEKYIDESRYCRSFINDKYKYSKWGKIKIAFTLKSKRIDQSLIYDTFDEVIDQEIYIENLTKALSDKKKTTKGNSQYEIKSKLFRFAASRGYETEDINSVINSIL